MITKLVYGRNPEGAVRLKKKNRESQCNFRLFFAAVVGQNLGRDRAQKGRRDAGSEKPRKVVSRQANQRELPSSAPECEHVNN